MGQAVVRKGTLQDAKRPTPSINLYDKGDVGVDLLMFLTQQAPDGKEGVLAKLRKEYDLDITISNSGVISLRSGDEAAFSGFIEWASAACDSGEIEPNRLYTLLGFQKRAAQRAEAEDAPTTGTTLKTWKKPVSARSPNQALYLQALMDNELVFGLGPAGTGKTYLAVAAAVAALKARQVDRIILSRPAVEAGERLGFLPGDMKDKVDPYLRPLYDALYDMMDGAAVEKLLASGEIEVAPLAFMRGRTLAHAFVILDEAQNTTATQMKMFLTRLGEDSRMAINGDLSQIDLSIGTKSGLKDALEALDGVPGIGFVEFTADDVVRHPLVTKMVKAYNKRDARVAELATQGTELTNPRAVDDSHGLRTTLGRGAPQPTR